METDRTDRRYEKVYHSPVVREKVFSLLGKKLKVYNPWDWVGYKWLNYWHGNGQINQYRYYRCEYCHKLITWHKIEVGGCSCNMTTKMRPASMSFWEMTRCLLMPWTV